MGLLKNYKRAKRLIAEDDKRIELERAEKEKRMLLTGELKELDTKQLDYVQTFTQLDISAKELNLATVYRELNRVKLSLYTLVPNLYLEAFKTKPCIVFDTIYIRNAEMSSYPKSLTEIEAMLQTVSAKENWPPKKIDLDSFEDAVYYSLHSSIGSDIKRLQTFFNIIATLQ